MENLTFKIEELAEFLVRAKRATYAGDGKEVNPERPGFKELEFLEGDWNYRDSYAGFFMAPGQEVVRFKGEPVWTMSYSGGMSPELLGDEEFARQTFRFLKEALSQVDAKIPYRGPSCAFSRNFPDFHYSNLIKGDITSFRGHEKIFYSLKEISGRVRCHHDPVFEQDYIGGLILPKTYRK